uniref:Uncharacterized protein n=1 Tax=Rhizophora mucronata TaxID=61149 RepID=A0A2P2MBL6_RHIMU
MALHRGLKRSNFTLFS